MSADLHQEGAKLARVFSHADELREHRRKERALGERGAERAAFAHSRANANDVVARVGVADRFDRVVERRRAAARRRRAARRRAARSGRRARSGAACERRAARAGSCDQTRRPSSLFAHPRRESRDARTESAAAPATARCRTAENARSVAVDRGRLRAAALEQRDEARQHEEEEHRDGDGSRRREQQRIDRRRENLAAELLVALELIGEPLRTPRRDRRSFRRRARVRHRAARRGRDAAPAPTTACHRARRARGPPGARRLTSPDATPDAALSACASGMPTGSSAAIARVTSRISRRRPSRMPRVPPSRLRRFRDVEHEQSALLERARQRARAHRLRLSTQPLSRIRQPPDTRTSAWCRLRGRRATSNS